MKKYDYLIVGAGLFGATFANEAKKKEAEAKTNETKQKSEETFSKARITTLAETTRNSISLTANGIFSPLQKTEKKNRKGLVCLNPSGLTLCLNMPKSCLSRFRL